jgi:hypothetical protein
MVEVLEDRDGPETARGMGLGVGRAGFGGGVVDWDD